MHNESLFCLIRTAEKIQAIGSAIETKSNINAKSKATQSKTQVVKKMLESGSLVGLGRRHAP